MKRTSRARLWLLDRLPGGLVFQPAEWLFSLLCLVSGTRVLLGGASSASLESLLPPPLYAAWGVFLVLGAVALASGLLSIRRVDPGDRYVVTRVPAYRLGLRLLGLSTFVYAGALVGYAGSAGLIAAVFPLAFSGMCGLRLLALGGR